MGDVGDVDVESLDFTTIFGRITETIRAIRRKNALPAVLGGDHSISFRAIRFYALPSLTPVHFDAHVDSYGQTSQSAETLQAAHVAQGPRAGTSYEDLLLSDVAQDDRVANKP